MPETTTLPEAEEMTTTVPVEGQVEEHAEEGGEHVQLAAEPAFMIGDFTVTNTMVATSVTTVLVLIFAILVRVKAGVIPSRMQVVFELIYDEFYVRIEEAVGEKRARKLVGIILTLFIFILFANLFILLPLVGSFVTEHGHFMRTPTTDYSMTIALALVTMGAAHLIAFTASPLGHIGNFIRVKPFWDIIRGKRPVSELFNAGIELFLGFLEIIGEFVKVISLATRLFGNILAGEVVIVVISGLMFATQFVVPIPFIALASFAGLIQAFVFTLLTTIFITNNLVHATHHEH
jgi:F-type H+-transporting ATPase subunit a